MKLSTYQAEIKKMIDQRNGYLLLSSGLLIICFLMSLTIIFLSGRERIILMPPNMSKDIWISNEHSSREYLERITFSLSELALNVTADNVDYQQEQLLQYADPSYYTKLKPELVALSDKIKNEHITTSFFPADIKVDCKKNEAIIIGDLKTFVGDTLLPTKRVSYHFVYRFNAFTPLIMKFEEVKNA